MAYYSIKIKKGVRREETVYSLAACSCRGKFDRTGNFAKFHTRIQESGETPIDEGVCVSSRLGVLISDQDLERLFPVYCVLCIRFFLDPFAFLLSPVFWLLTPGYWRSQREGTICAYQPTATSQTASSIRAVRSHGALLSQVSAGCACSEISPPHFARRRQVRIPMRSLRQQGGR
jgi:hypothetical protein